MKKLKSKYENIKDNNSETGRRSKAWKFYSCTNEVLGDKPATRPRIVIDALQEAEQSEEEFNDGARDVEVTDAVVEDEKMVGENASGNAGVEDTNEKVLESDVEVKPQVDNKTVVKTER